MSLRGLQPEDPYDRTRAVDLLLNHPWRAATSQRYKTLPHEYTLRRQWPDAADFEWVVEHIRAVGYEQYFIGRIWIYYDIGEHQYWTMNASAPQTTLINRAVRRPPSARL